MNSDQARSNMIEQQIRPWNVNQPAVLAALESVRREDFVPNSHQALAFSDVAIPLDNGSHMLEPKVAAQLANTMNLQSEDTVLQIGAGSGYLTALLAQLAHRVTVIEQDPITAEAAQQKIAMAGIENVHYSDTPTASSIDLVDAIVIRDGVRTVDDRLFEQLAVNGRLVAVVGDLPTMELTQFIKHSDRIEAHSIVDTVVPHASAQASADTRIFVF